MTTKYIIESKKNLEKKELILEVAFTDNRYSGEEIVKDVAQQFQELGIENLCQGVDILKINGSMSMLLTYMFIHEFQHLVKVIAYTVPQENTNFIIVYSAIPEYTIGDTIIASTGEKKPVIKPQEKTKAFTANISDDTLNINCVLGITTLDILAKEAEEAIDDLLCQGFLQGGNLLKINGKSAMTVNMVIAHKLVHRYANIAIWSPYLNDYVVVLNHGGKYQVGQCLNFQTEKIANKKIVICGQARRGKTVLRDGLRLLLRQYMPNQDYFVTSGCPDGDRAWYNEAYKNNPEKAQELKKKYQSDFTPKWAKGMANSLKPINTPLLLFDVGGKTIDKKLTEENKIIMPQATHAIIVGGNEEEIDIWRRGCQELGIIVIAEVSSKLSKNIDEPVDEVTSRDPIFAVTIHDLRREADISQSQGIHMLAEFLAGFYQA